MAKINIPFNGADYLIEEFALTSATTDLQSHLSTSMSGTGATIDLGGNTYNVDSTKLTTERNAFITHLETIAGTGSKVTVGDVEYGVDSNKMSAAVTELEATFGNLAAWGSVESKGLEYTLESDGKSYALTSVGTCEDTNIVIPRLHEGLPVTKIGNRVFMHNQMTSVVIPDTVTTIGVYAFGYCSKLTTLIIPDSITYIDNYAFYECIGLTISAIPNNVTYIGNYAFAKCSGLTDITIGDGVETISDRAFYACSNLKRVVFGSNLTTIRDDVFDGCYNIDIYDFRRAAVIPTLRNTRSIFIFDSNDKIIVPDELYEAWISKWGSNYETEDYVKASEYIEA